MMRICVLFISFAEQYEAYNFTFFNFLKFLLLSQYFITVLGQGSILLPWLGEALITFTLLSLLDFQRLHFQRLQLPRHFPTRGFRACALGDRLEGGKNWRLEMLCSAHACRVRLLMMTSGPSRIPDWKLVACLCNAFR